MFLHWHPFLSLIFSLPLLKKKLLLSLTLVQKRVSSLSLLLILAALAWGGPSRNTFCLTIDEVGQVGVEVCGSCHVSLVGGLHVASSLCH